MKKILATLFAAFLSIAAFSNTEKPGHPNDSLTPLDVKSINTKAVKNFRTRYANIQEPVWYTSKSGTVSCFKRDGYINRVYYDKNGRWAYSLLFYNENKLDREVRKAIKINYYDQDITLVEEIQTLTGLTYVITLEDKSSLKFLKINLEGEMQIIQELDKK